MPSPIQLSLSAHPHNNQQLFSDHYLDVNLPKSSDWQALAAQAEPVMKEITGIFSVYQASNNEAQTEENLIRPILKALGHPYEVQTALKTPDSKRHQITSSIVIQRLSARIRARC